MSEENTTWTGPILGEVRSLWRFLADVFIMAVVGSVRYYAWLAALGILLVVGLYSYAIQFTTGALTLGIRQQVPWGLYIALWGYFVEIGTGAVVVLAFAYTEYGTETFRRQSIIAGGLAISGIVAGLAAVLVDLGRPTRTFNLLPVTGTMNFPDSMFAWDTLALNGYLVLIAVAFGVLLYRRFTRRPLGRWVGWVLYIAVPWALFILVVDPFIFGGVAARGTWNSAIIAPRFIVGAFAVGPAVTIITIDLLERYTRVTEVFDDWIPDGYHTYLGSIMLIALVGGLIIFLSEVFVSWYARTAHWVPIQYLILGVEHHGHVYDNLVPWTWTMLALQLVAVFILVPMPFPQTRRSRFWILLASIATAVSIFIDKVILVVSGFVLTPLGELYEYTPTLLESMVALGTVAVGLVVLTVLLRVGLAIELDGVFHPDEAPAPREVLENRLALRDAGDDEAD